MTTQLIERAIIENLIAADGTPGQVATIVVRSTESVGGLLIQSGNALVDGEWLCVTGCDGLWQADWSDRQQAYIVVQDKAEIERLTALVG